MSGLLGKFGPTAVVATVVAWCCWPYLVDTDSELDLDQDTSVPVIASSLLSPTFAPLPERNPFAPESAQNRPFTVEAAFSALSGLLSLLADKGPIVAKTGQAPSAEPSLRELVRNLPLEATYCQGERSIALIDGQLYAKGDSLFPSEPLSEPCVVAQISAHRVLLRRKGQAVELTYRDPFSPPDVPEKLEIDCNSSQESCPPQGTTTQVE